jgi:protein CWC15
VAKRDLRAELLAAEHEAREKKRKAEGRPVITAGDEDDDTSKRRKLLQDTINLDKDDEDEDAPGDEAGAGKNVDADER